MKDNRRNMPIRKVISVLFLATMVISIFGIGYMVFANWFSSAKQASKSTAAEMNERINNQIYSFLSVPEQINESNQKIIVNGILDLSQENLRDMFFVGVLSSYKENIYSFSFSTENGEYFGARRNETGGIQLIKNNAATGGNSWYYSVNDDLTAGEIIVQAEQFDPRNQAWYKAAVAAEVPIFSPPKKSFEPNDFTISYSSPIYNKDGTFQGVLGTQMLLDDVRTYLEDTVSHYNGYAAIFEKSSNELIANSSGNDNFAVFQDSTLERDDNTKIRNADIQEAYAQYKSSLNPNFIYGGEDQNLYINVKEIHLAGLDWVVVSAIPEDYLITPAIQSVRSAAILAVFLLMLSYIEQNRYAIVL